jgi:hypothetical protein
VEKPFRRKLGLPGILTPNIIYKNQPHVITRQMESLNV